GGGGGGAGRMSPPGARGGPRLGRVRIYRGDNPSLRVGAFARGSIVTATGDGLALPAAAVLFAADGPMVQLIRDHRVESRKLTIGLSAGGIVEGRSGVSEGDLVVARPGTFLRDGDPVRPIEDHGKVSETRQ